MKKRKKKFNGPIERQQQSENVQQKGEHIEDPLKNLSIDNQFECSSMIVQFYDNRDNNSSNWLSQEKKILLMRCRSIFYHLRNSSMIKIERSSLRSMSSNSHLKQQKTKKRHSKMSRGDEKLDNQRKWPKPQQDQSDQLQKWTNSWRIDVKNVFIRALKRASVVTREEFQHRHSSSSSRQIKQIDKQMNLFVLVDWWDSYGSFVMLIDQLTNEKRSTNKFTWLVKRNETFYRFANDEKREKREKKKWEKKAFGSTFVYIFFSFSQIITKNRYQQSFE